MTLSRAAIADGLGCDPALVTRYRRRGMPMDSVDAALAWKRMHVRPRIGGDQAGGSAPHGPPTPPANDEPDSGGYWASRARREQAEADLAELKLAEQRGELVRTADVRASHARRLASLRESLLQIPPRLAAVLAAEADQAKVHDALAAEIHAALAVAVQP